MKMKELDIAIHNAAPDEETRQNLHQTVNISKMTDEQVDALLSGKMTWEEAFAASPGPAIRIEEVSTEAN